MSSFVMKKNRCFVDRRTPTGFKAVTLLVMAAKGFEVGFLLGIFWWSKHTQVKGLILAQNERWRRGLGMRVARECSNTGKRRKGEDNMGNCPGDEDSVGKLTVILDNIYGSKV